MSEGAVCLITIGILAAFLALYGFIYSYVDRGNRIKSLEGKLASINSKTPIESIKYTNELLEAIRSLVSQIAILKFNIFKDSHVTDKVMKGTLAELAKEVAIEANKSLDRSKVRSDRLIVTMKFIEQYIIDISMMLVKEMWEKYYE